MTETPILDKAKKLLTGDRAEAWGSALESFCRIAVLWEPIFRRKVTPREVALAMIALKLSRAIGSPCPDSFVDLAGYAELANSLPPDTDAHFWLIERKPYTV